MRTLSQGGGKSGYIEKLASHPSQGREKNERRTEANEVEAGEKRKLAGAPQKPGTKRRMG